MRFSLGCEANAVKKQLEFAFWKLLKLLQEPLVHVVLDQPPGRAIPTFTSFHEVLSGTLDGEALVVRSKHQKPSVCQVLVPGSGIHPRGLALQKSPQHVMGLDGRISHVAKYHRSHMHTYL